MRLKYDVRSAEQTNRLANFLIISLALFTVAGFTSYGLYKLGVPPIIRFTDPDQRKVFMKEKEKCEKNPILANKLGGTDIELIDNLLCAESLFRSSIRKGDQLVLK